MTDDLRNGPWQRPDYKADGHHWGESLDPDAAEEWADWVSEAVSPVEESEPTNGCSGSDRTPG